jgi:Trk K+ transport system NAD-binding subunit
MHTSPDPKFMFERDDIVFITGKREDINKALVYITGGKVDDEASIRHQEES